ncbi:MAG: T4 RnlA family RNA ligase [Bacteroidota bacterium]
MITKGINMTKVHEMIDQGYIMTNKHPNANLWIYNYTQSAQYDQIWNEETLICRGLILDQNHEAVARPISKFFNLEEIGYRSLPDLPFEVYEKMDGSLGILYWLDNKPFIATRNSFESLQAIEANNLLNTKYKSCINQLERSKTYVFEIIYPENRIVVDYKDRKELILLAIIDTQTGDEEELIDIGFPLPKKYAEFNDLAKMKSLNWKNQEGFVIKFSNNFRVKLKFEEYIATHKIVTQLSSTIIWQHLSEEKDLMPTLKDVPDEFYAWVKKTELNLRAQFNEIDKITDAEMRLFDTDRETAAYFMTCSYPKIMFSKWRMKKYEKLIWRMIKPPFEKAFSNQKL